MSWVRLVDAASLAEVEILNEKTNATASLSPLLMLKLLVLAPEFVKDMAPQLKGLELKILVALILASCDYTP